MPRVSATIERCDQLFLIFSIYLKNNKKLYTISGADQLRLHFYIYKRNKNYVEFRYQSAAAATAVIFVTFLKLMNKHLQVTTRYQKMSSPPVTSMLGTYATQIYLEGTGCKISLMSVAPHRDQVYES